MKIRALTVAIFLGTALAFCESLYAWGNKMTHPALTRKGVGHTATNSIVDHYLKGELGLANGIETNLYWDFSLDIKNRLWRGEAQPDKTTRTVLEWMEAGSNIEDEDGDKYPIRARHHFHDPSRDSGLDNKTDHPEWKKYLPSFKWDFTGTSALVWAVEGVALQEPTDNEHYWDWAREDFHRGITEESLAEREKHLAMAFMDIGHILHLIEDMGVPAHARNDWLFGHYRGALDNGNPFEDWVEKQVNDNNGQSLWSGSGPVVFDKLAKCFDASRGPNSGDSQ